MTLYKSYVNFVLILSLFISHNPASAYFAELTNATRIKIMRDTALMALASATFAGSLAAASDISQQKAMPKETLWQKLKRVDWKKVATISAGAGAAGGLITSLYSYCNAPEWNFNALEGRYLTLKTNVQGMVNNAVVQGLMGNDQTELNRATAQESFGVVAAFDYLDSMITKFSGWESFSEKEIASIKQSIQPLMVCQIPEVATKARALLVELNASQSVNALRISKAHLQDWMIKVRSNPFYVLELEKKTQMESHVARVAAETKTAAAQELAAQAKHKLAEAEMAKAAAQQISAQAKLAQARK